MLRSPASNKGTNRFKEQKRLENDGFWWLVALFDAVLLCSPPSNSETKCVACAGFVWQANTGDAYCFIVVITTTTSATTTTAAAAATATATRTVTATVSSTTTSGFHTRGRIQIFSRT